jgi:hypothetical protein
MPDSDVELWCFIVGGRAPLLITPPSPTLRIAKVKELIKDQASNFLQGVDAHNLTLWMVRYF